LAEPPALSPSTKKSSVIVLSFEVAGVNLPDKLTSLLFLLRSLRASRRAFRASLAYLTVLFAAMAMTGRWRRLALEEIFILPCRKTA